MEPILTTSKFHLLFLKLVGFATFYGFVLINSIDLWGSSLPAYHLWLIAMYLAPFELIIIFEGSKGWEVALAFGLLSALMNDVFYYVAGDLIFGMHVNVIHWWAGQLFFLNASGGGWTFQGGFFHFVVPAWLMTVSIWARVFVVSALLYRWWSS
jgi:hypothetical protein